MKILSFNALNHRFLYCDGNFSINFFFYTLSLKNLQFASARANLILKSQNADDTLHSDVGELQNFVMKSILLKNC